MLVPSVGLLAMAVLQLGHCWVWRAPGEIQYGVYSAFLDGFEF